MPRTLIVCGTYNERDNLDRFIRSVRATLPTADLLITDDNSPDGTGAVADALAAADARIRVIHRPRKLGLGSAYVQAFSRGICEGYDRFFQMDADLSHDAGYLPEFMRTLDAGYDIVIGSRNVPGGGVIGWGPLRHVISKGGSLYARTILGLPFRDLTSGYKAYSRRALEAIHLDDIRSNGYSFQIETTYRAVLRNMRVKEVPILFADRTMGRSKMSRKIFFEAAFMVWRLRYEALRYSP
ncbi:MAG TPA: polyprenol monophosphomannose synthase [Polyangiaceae bacterium]|nr:polyprenol monophosphomannose synthase [Polyangiaceae bacterium]